MKKTKKTCKWSLIGLFVLINFTSVYMALAEPRYIKVDEIKDNCYAHLDYSCDGEHIRLGCSNIYAHDICTEYYVGCYDCM